MPRPVKRSVVSFLFAVMLMAGGAAPIGSPRMVTAACTVFIFGSQWDLGAYSVFSATPTDAVKPLAYHCDADVPTPLRINLSSGLGTNFNPRLLDSLLSDYMSYNLYLDAAHTKIFGDGTNGTFFYQVAGFTYVPTSSGVSLPVFSRIPAGQDLIVSGYSDVIIATLVY